jgi:hypothetical protein
MLNDMLAHPYMMMLLVASLAAAIEGIREFVRSCRRAESTNPPDFVPSEEEPKWKRL